MKQTSIHSNPFHILGATTRDNRHRIVELAEEKNLILDSQACTKARTDLTNPRNRLAAEIAWLPGLSPRRAQELLSNLQQDIDSLKGQNSLPFLANANLLAAAFELLDSEMDASNWSDWIWDFAQTVDLINPEDVMRDINEDRAISGFPEVQEQDAIEAELSEHRRYYKRAIRDALNLLSPMQIAKVLTMVVEIGTNSGEDHAPLLIDELIDSYEIDTKSYLQRDADNIKTLIDGARAAAPQGINAVRPFIDKISVIINKWDQVAEPIQLSMKSRGMNHDISQDLATAIRSLGVDLFNQYDMLELSDRITKILQKVFDELPEIMLHLQEDSESIENIIVNRRETHQRKKEWEREITYEADLGILIKDRLSISSKGVQWKDTLYPLDSITRVRWGGVRHSVNGIPTGTTYTIAFGDQSRETVVNIGKRDVYSTFIDKLWRAVCVRLLTEYLEKLKAGKRIFFGDAAVDDLGIDLTKHKFLASENVYCKWEETHIWNANGSFIIGAKNDKKTYVEISYIQVPNTHILESIISMSFKKWKGRLSGLIQDE
jgi:hypothetical protein